MRYNTALYNTNLYTSPVFIVDRTQADVDNKTIKGAWNVADANRVEYRISELTAMLKFIGLDEILTTCKTNWAAADYFLYEDITRIRNNIRAQQAQLISYVPQLAITSSKYPVPGDINILEQALSNMEIAIENIVQQQDKFSGTLVSGEGVLI